MLFFFFLAFFLARLAVWMSRKIFSCLFCSSQTIKSRPTLSAQYTNLRVCVCVSE
jgi:hypothetical protein